ncbi:hypothetical protein B0I00_0513 [Novosphingobium kunmingense]|uniref:DUF91 domain-containing protein n=1 Tax=Novosphingobium kunmingense TaxID=1211806 RepID=A0A2N0I297_9SPHN|nr:hypothetical protein [Novosphingobium kunmingense]PKB25318.1 hypothetical protein B0I00_0513 [Novosphingobium kunmingense]
MTKLWNIDGDSLSPMTAERLDAEDRLERWLEADISILDPSLLVIGRQVVTSHQGRIDLIAINAEGSVTVIELKRDRTPRDIVAQVLDYASWVSGLDTPAVHVMADEYLRRRGSGFVEAFQRKFGGPPPEPLNATHSMVIVASALDPASQRIVEYLARVHDVGINTAFFTVFGDGRGQYLAADWLMDQEEVVERTERRAKAPWSGLWYVNVGEGESRCWEDMRTLGFLAAGGGRTYSGAMDKLEPGARIYAYQKGAGYVGFGTVTEAAVMARDAVIDGRPLFDYSLAQPNIRHHSEDPELAEYIVRVDWQMQVPLPQAKTFPGVFANQNVVCRLRDAATLDFLAREFGAPE